MDDEEWLSERSGFVKYLGFGVINAGIVGLVNAIPITGSWGRIIALKFLISMAATLLLALCFRWMTRKQVRTEARPGSRSTGRP